MSPTVTLETQVHRVTVHRNGALVTRRGALQTPTSWPQRLSIPGLPLLFQSDTVRVRVEHPAVSAGPVEELPELGTRPAPGPELRQQRDALKVELLALEDQDRAWIRLQEAADALVLPTSLDLARREEARWPDLGAWAALTDAADAQREAVAAARAGLRARIRALGEEITAIERRMQVESSPPSRVSRGLCTTLQREGSGELPATLPVEIEYFVAGARWAPAYHLELGGVVAKLTLSAWVGQATGEDWASAEIAVSTADLRRTSSLPKLGVWKIGRATSPPPSGWRPLPEDTEGLFRDLDLALRARQPAPKPAPRKAAKARRQAAEADEEITGAAPPPEQVRLAPAPPPPPMMAESAAFFQAPRPSAPRGVAAGPPPAPMAPPAPQASMPPPGAMPARAKSANLLSRARFEAEESLDLDEGAGAAPEPAPPPPLNPGRLLDYAWLRLPRWDEAGRRGRLWPVDAFADLRALAEERGDTSRAAEVERALSALREAMARLASAPLPPGCVPIDGSSFQYRFPASGRASVPADGRFVQVPVAVGSGPVETLFRVVPRQSAQVFRSVRFSNPLAAPLPMGPVRVTDRGDVRVAGALGPVGAGGKITLDLGVEEGLRVARNASFAEAEKGMLSAQSVGTNTVRTEIRSRLGERVRVQVFERLPLAPEGSELSVALESASREPTRDVGPDGDRQEGALRWELDILPGAAAELTYVYTLKLPAKLEVVGGARREP